MSNPEEATQHVQYVRVELVIERVVDYPRSANLLSAFTDLGLVAEPQENMWVVTYDSMKQIRTVTQVARGGYHDVTIHVPTVLSAVFLAATDRFVVVHNHPAGDVTPTQLDIELTKTIMTAANVCGLYFEDHLVVGPPNHLFSMAAEGLLIPSPDLKLMAAGKRPRR